MGNLGRVIPATQGYGGFPRRLGAKLGGFLFGHRTTLQLQTQDRRRTELSQIVLIRRDEVAFGGHMQSDRINHLRRKPFLQPPPRQCLMHIVHTRVGRVIGKGMQQVSDVV